MSPMNYRNAYTEVYEILSYLDENEYNKIPNEVMEAIKLNRNLEYNYKLNEELDLQKQPMLIETKAILFNLFRDYLSTPKQKEKILRMQAEDRRKIEIEKQKMYEKRDIFKKDSDDNIYKYKEQTEIIKYDESIFRKMINFIKKILKK